MKKIIFLFCCLSTHAFSQSVDFFSKESKAVTQSDCNYFKIGFKLDGGYYIDTVRSYYCKDSTIRSIEVYSEKSVLNGISWHYYPNGKIKEKRNYKTGALSGTSTKYYKNGKAKAILFYPEKSYFKDGIPHNYLILNYWDSLGTIAVTNSNGFCDFDDFFIDTEVVESGRVKNGLRDSTWVIRDLKGKILFIEDYENGIFLSGQKLLEDNTKLEYKEFFISTQPSGGMQNFYEFVGNNLRYPQQARRLGIQGKVFVEVIIDESGVISDVVIFNGVHEEIDREAIRVIKRAPNWKPANLRATPVKMKMVLPITFRLG